MLNWIFLLLGFYQLVIDFMGASIRLKCCNKLLQVYYDFIPKDQLCQRSLDQPLKVWKIRISLKVQIKWNIVHLWWHCVWLEKYINENDENCKYPKDVDFVQQLFPNLQFETFHDVWCGAFIFLVVIVFCTCDILMQFACLINF